MGQFETLIHKLIKLLGENNPGDSVRHVVNTISQEMSLNYYDGFTPEQGMADACYRLTDILPNIVYRGMDVPEDIDDWIKEVHATLQEFWRVEHRKGYNVETD